MDQPLQRALEIIIKVAAPEKVILFGSRAKNINNEQSDYDLLVLKHNGEKPRSVARAIYANLDKIGAPVDIIVTDIDQYESLKNNPYLVYCEAEKHGRLVYAKS